MKSFASLRQQLDEITYKQDKKNHISSTKIKNTEVAYHAERKGSKKIRVFVKPKSAKDWEELGVFKDMNTAKKSVEQFVKLMGEDIDEGVSMLSRLVEKAQDKFEQEMSEAKELDQKVIDKIAQMTDKNDHNASVLLLARMMREKRVEKMMDHIIAMHKINGSMSSDMINIRKEMLDQLMKKAKRQYSNFKDVYSAF